MEADCESLRALRPPSTALPLLRSFTFRAPDHSHEAQDDVVGDEDEDDGEEEEEDEEDEN